MILSYLIMCHCDEPSSRGICFKFKTQSFELPLPFSSSLIKNRTTWNHTFQSKERGLVTAMARDAMSFAKSSFSITGLCFTFSFPWRFKLIWTFSISFDDEGLSSVKGHSSKEVQWGSFRRNVGNQEEWIYCKVHQICFLLQKNFRKFVSSCPSHFLDCCFNFFLVAPSLYQDKNIAG